jgi:hypothetical protein
MRIYYFEGPGETNNNQLLAALVAKISGFLISAVVEII